MDTVAWCDNVVTMLLIDTCHLLFLTCTICIEGQGRAGQGREGKGREGKGREGKGREGKGREGKGREGKGREGKGREHCVEHCLFIKLLWR